MNRRLFTISQNRYKITNRKNYEIMKTKIPVLLLLFLGLSSCIKDYLGHGDDTNDNGFLTEKNYFYADDLKTAFLEDKSQNLSIELNNLQIIIDAGQADDATKIRYAEVKDELLTIDQNLSSVASYRDLVFRGGVPPLPPCPKPRNCNDWLNFIYVTPNPSYEKFQLIIYDDQQNVIAQTEGDPQPLLGVDGQLNYLDLIWINKEFKGDIFVIAVGEINGDPEEIFSKSSIQ